MKKCSTCYKELCKSLFSKHSKSRDGLQNNCKPCMKKYRKEWAKNPENERKRKLRNKYNMTLQEYDNLLKEQDYSCAICNSKETRNKRYNFLPVDHCHKTNKVRGILCDYCNVGLGRFEDDIERMKRAIQYLEESRR